MACGSIVVRQKWFYYTKISKTHKNTNFGAPCSADTEPRVSRFIDAKPRCYQLIKKFTRCVTENQNCVQKLLSKRNSLYLSTLSVYQQSLSPLSKQKSLWKLLVSRKLLSEKTKPKISLRTGTKVDIKGWKEILIFSIRISPDSFVMFHQQSFRYRSCERHTYRFRTASTRWQRSMDPPTAFHRSCDECGRCL